MTRVTMYDDVNVSLLPADATHIACYVDGTYENQAAIRARFPKARLLTIDVRGSYRNGDCLDVEPGDATNADAVGWFKAREGHTSTPKPVLYTSASNVAALVATMTAAGIARDRYYVWSAHYNGIPHICGGCGYPTADGTQWTDHALGRSLDQSLMEGYVFGAGPVQQHPNVTAMRAAARRALRANPRPSRIRTAAQSVLRALRGIR